jgi:hypothetical protein
MYGYHIQFVCLILSASSAQIAFESSEFYSRPNLKFGSVNSTQGILRLVVSGNVNVYRLDEKKNK